MTRLVVAAFLALILHAALLWMEVPLTRLELKSPQNQSIRIELVTFQKSDEKAPPPPPKKSPEPAKADQILEPDINVQEKPMAEPAPVASEDTTIDQPKDQVKVRASVPRYDLNPPPHYPYTARRRNYQGTVLLDVRVTTDGRVAQVRIAESSGHVILDRSAVKSVKDWQFTPARQANRPVQMWVQVPIRYQLE